MLAAAGAVVGYAVVCAVSLVGVKARPLSSRRVPTRVNPDGTFPEEPLS